MNNLKSDAELIAGSGRTIEEHWDIVRALERDPKGNKAVTLDFESGDFEGWSVRRLAQPYSAVIQRDVVRCGTRACRFEIRPGDRIAGGLRAELRDWFNAPFEEDTWYGFSTYLPAGFEPPKDAVIVLAQWHDQAELGDPAGKPPLAMRYRNGSLRFTGACSEVASQEPDKLYVFHEIADVPHGMWLDFVFRIHWSRLGQASIAAFQNGQPLFDFVGALGYRNEIKGPYFKLGVYTAARIDEPLVVYHDNYSRAGSFAEVDPSVLHSQSGGQ